MSLLDQILKAKLKSTETIVTCPDGQRYLESKDSLVLLRGSTHGYIVDYKPDDTPAYICENLYLGSQDCCEKNVLLKYNVKYVLSIGIKASVTYEGIIYKHVDCLDLPETNILSTFNESHSFISDAISNGNNILVHCNAGVSRSASVVIAYLICTNRMKYVDAFNKVKSARPCIRPNDGFVKQLKTI